MRVLYIDYALWKSVVQTRGFATFHKTVEASTRKVWAGLPEVVFHTDVRPSDFSDWQTNFESASTLVSDEDTALANIVGLGATLQPRSADGTPITAVQQLTLGQSSFLRIDDGTALMNIDGRALGTPVNVWDGTGIADTGANDWAVNGIGSETAGSMHAGTNGWDSGLTTDVSDVTRFSDSADSDIAGTYAELRFWMQPKAFPAGARLRVEWQKADNTQIGATLNVANYVTNMDLDVWQQVAIPISDFGLTEDVSRVRFRYRTEVGQQFWFDELQLVPVGSGPYRFRVTAPDANTRYHISMVVFVVSGASSGWNQSTFANISALPLGLNVRQRRLSTGDVLWKFNSKDNNDLFGRYHPQDDIEFADGTLLVGFMLKPGKASILVTDDDILEFVVRDDLSTLASARAYAHYGVEVIS